MKNLPHTFQYLHILFHFFNLNALAHSWKTLLSSCALVWNPCLILDLHRIASITALL